MLCDAAGRRGTVQAIRFDPNWTSLLAGVTQFCISGLANLPNTVMDTSAAFPALEDLTLYITPVPGVSSTASSWFRWPKLACSRLRVVRFRSSGARSSISLDTVHSFILHSLERGTRTAKLEMLSLDRVDVAIPPDVDGVASLHELVEKVDVQDLASAWQLRCKTSWEEVVGSVCR